MAVGLRKERVVALRMCLVAGVDGSERRRMSALEIN
jgi:hypothetical protein